MASRPWSDEEAEILEQFADHRDWLDKALEHLPDRTPTALRSRMQLIRAGTGRSNAHSNGSEWMSDAMNASRQLLEAIQRAGVHPV
jgi:hypothetical protein